MFLCVPRVVSGAEWPQEKIIAIDFVDGGSTLKDPGTSGLVLHGNNTQRCVKTG